MTQFETVQTRSQSGLLAHLQSAQAVPLLPATLIVAIVIAWAATGGGYESLPALDAGYDPGPWYLGALAITGLLCVTAAGLGSIRLARLTVVACAALGGYVVWSFLSVLWASDQGVAFLGSDRTLVYFATFATFAILPWRSWSARVALGLFVAGIGALAIIVAIKVAVLADPGGLYIRQRLAYPLGYYNADAALFTMAAVVAIALSARRSTPAVLRVAASTVAALCLQLAVLSQSRGWLFTVPLLFVAMLVLVPGRLRLLAAMFLPAVATALAAPPLLHVYGRSTPNGTALEQPHLSAVLHQQGSHAMKIVLIVDVALAVVSALLVWLDGRVKLKQTTQRRIDRVAATLAIAAVLAGLVAGLVAVHGDPVGRAERAWHSFADASNNSEGGSSRFGTLASHRADIWRVALHDFAQHPLEGIGQDNFAASYTKLRHSDEEPRWTHSIELRLLTHTGIVGALLFALFLTAALLGAFRGRAKGSAERVTAGLLLLPLVVWLAQGSIDWFWEYPALSVPALGFLAAAGALGRTRSGFRSTPVEDSATSGAALQGDAATQGSAAAQGDEPATVVRLPGPRPMGGRSVAGWLLAGVLSLAAMGALAVPFLAARHAQRATQVWSAHPSLAYRELRSATKLMPFYSQLYLVGGAIALNLNELEYARRWFEQAGTRENQNWLVPFSLGLIDGEQHKPRQALAELRSAKALNPTEPLIEQALSSLREGHPMTFTEVQTAANPHIATPHA